MYDLLVNYKTKNNNMIKKFMQKIALTILFSITCTFVLAQADVNTEFGNRVNYIFGQLDKSKVPNGLLLDYAMEFTDLANYNGILTDTNKTNAGIMRDIYSTIALSSVHNNAGAIYHPSYIDSLWDVQRTAGLITLCGVYYNYSQLRTDAWSNGLLNITNEQLQDKYNSGVWQNPYETKTVFAMAPPLHQYSGRAFNVKLPNNLWFTNGAASVAQLEINFGNGYNTLTPNQSIPVSYADTGVKVWTFKLSLTNGTILYSHTLMHITPEPNKPTYSPGTGSRFSPNGHTPQPLIADTP